jgi:hypothetical protein
VQDPLNIGTPMQQDSKPSAKAGGL